MHALGDGAQTARAVINGIHRRNDGEKDLRRANVTGRFFAPDVLLARLQGQTISRPTFGIVRNADRENGHMPLVLFSLRTLCSVWCSEAACWAKPLSVTASDIRSNIYLQCCSRSKLLSL